MSLNAATAPLPQDVIDLVDDGAQAIVWKPTPHLRWRWTAIPTTTQKTERVLEQLWEGYRVIYTCGSLRIPELDETTVQSEWRAVKEAV